LEFGCDEGKYYYEGYCVHEIEEQEPSGPPEECDDGATLARVVKMICLEAGLTEDQIDVSLLEGEVRGFPMSNAHPAYQGLEALARIFLFDPVNYDGKIHFQPRGWAPVADVPTEEVVDDGGDIDVYTRRDAISVPRVMHLEFYSPMGGLNPEKQTSDRSIDTRAVAEAKFETTLILDPTEAARVVNINHKVASEEQRGGFEFALPDSWLKLAVGNVITMAGDRLRINEVEIDEGYQRYKTSFDRVGSYASTAQPFVPPPPPPPAPTFVGATQLEIVETRILRDADDRLGYYLAAAGFTENWAGCVVEVSRDGGANYDEAHELTAETVMGRLVTALPAHSRDYPDSVNTCQIQLLRGDMELESATLAQMQNRTNLAMIGDELVNFGGAEEVTAGTWNLSYFLRGRKRTPVLSHNAGERFVLLRRPSLLLLDVELFELRTPLTFRATSKGADLGLTQTVTIFGRSQLEVAPAYLKVVRDSGLSITWQGIGRLGGGVNIGMGQYFTGYRVTVGSTVYSTTDQSLAIADPGGALVIKVQQVNSLTGVGPALEVTV